MLDQHKEALTASRQIVLRARDLNRRAGTTVCGINREQVVHVLLQQLNGARSFGEVQDASQLLLPDIDSALESQVRQQAPDEIEVLGRMIPLQYDETTNGQASVQASLQLTRQETEAQVFNDLPDKLCLPNGQPIMLTVYYNNGIRPDSIADNNLIVLKRCLKTRLLQERWQAFEFANRDLIVVPDVNDTNSAVAELVETSYDNGDSVVTVYGTVKALGCYRPYFGRIWLEDKDEAEAARADAIVALPRYREELQQQKARLAALPRSPFVSSSPSGFGWGTPGSTARRSASSSYVPTRSFLRWGPKRKRGDDSPRSRAEAAKERMNELVTSAEFTADLQDGVLITKLKGRKDSAIGKGLEAINAWLTESEQLLERVETHVRKNRHTRFLAEMEPKIDEATMQLLEAEGDQTAIQDASDMLGRVESLIKEGRAQEDDKDGKIDEAYELIEELQRLVAAAGNASTDA